MTVRDLICRLNLINLDWQVTDQDYSPICSIIRSDGCISLRSWNDVDKFNFVEMIADQSINSVENLSEIDIKANTMCHLDELGICVTECVELHIEGYIHKKLVEKNANADEKALEIKRLKAQHDKLQKELVDCMAKLIDLTNEKEDER